MDRDDEHSAHTDRRYASLDDSVIPDAENLKVTLERALPFWEDKIAPALKDGKNVFVGAHGNSMGAEVGVRAELVPQRRKHTTRDGADGLPGVRSRSKSVV